MLRCPQAAHASTFVLALLTVLACDADRNHAPDASERSTDASDAPCQTTLRARGVDFTPTVHQTEHPEGRPELDCSVEDPVLLVPVLHGVTFHADSLDGVAEPLLAACELALALERTAQALADRQVTDIAHYGIYGCRAIEGMSTLSEHALARAFDLAEVKLATGERYTVLDDWEMNAPKPGTRAGMFLRELVQSLYDDRVFNIILTPDFNAEHANHFHFDLTPGMHVLQ